METKATYVLGVDPGATTGMAILRVTTPVEPLDLELFVDRPLAIWSDELPWDEASDELARRLRHMRQLRESEQGVAAVGERFMVMAKTAQRGQEYIEAAMFMLGVMRREARLSRVPFSMQASSDKKMVGDKVLRGFRLYAPGMTHANDAYRHAVVYAVKNRLMAGHMLLRSWT